MNLFHLEHGLYWVQSGVLPKQFGHKSFLSLSAQLVKVVIITNLEQKQKSA